MKGKVILWVGIFLASCFAFTSCDNGSETGTIGSFQLKSDAFSNNQRLDTKYCYTGVTGGQNISLPFNWVGAPENAQSFALVIYDPDGGDWIHWAIFNIPTDCSAISEGASGKNMPEGSFELDNEFGTSGYGGPEPPVGTGTHRYIATLYALNTSNISGISGFRSYSSINTLLDEKIIEKTSIIGVYSR